MSRGKAKSKRFWTTFGVIALAVVISIAATIGLYKVTESFELGVTDLVYNRDNLVRQLEKYEGLAGNNGNGLTFDVKSDMSIRIRGKITSGDEQFEWILGEVTVEETGDYTLSGLNGASYASAYLKGVYTGIDGNTHTIYGDMSGVCTAELVEGTNVKLSIVIFEGTELNTTVTPTFTLGEEAGRF